MVRKHKKQKKIKTRPLVILLWLTVCAFVGFFLPQIPAVNQIVKIKKVEVQGFKDVDTTQIKKLFRSRSWMFLDTNRLADLIKQKYPSIGDVNIKIVSPGVVNIYLKKREIIGTVKYKTKLYALDNKFELVSLKYFNKDDLRNIKYNIVVNDEMLDKKSIKNIYKINEIIDNLKIKKYIINISQIVCILENGKILVFSKEDLNKSIKRAKSFFNKVNIAQYRYIDFSFDSIVVARR